jgi:hypothetical protein
MAAAVPITAARRSAINDGIVYTMILHGMYFCEAQCGTLSCDNGIILEARQTAEMLLASKRVPYPRAAAVPIMATQ